MKSVKDMVKTWRNNDLLNLSLFSLLQPLIVPKVSHEGDTINFDKYPDDGWKQAAPIQDKKVQSLFADF